VLDDPIMREILKPTRTIGIEEKEAELEDRKERV